ncbi:MULTISPECIES: serine hydrolase domain-containing protein [unclassified Pseudoalteromonas]|uniref:serine hydrolase domain-containing protein n=1 Tax=unclassified Pseudoalteromonas TaxID=194690 RepID=UPI00101EC390|nr:MULTISPECIES: serine hydrolase domain-containing protein [unclassified Pseudoalteromonas]MCG9709095.1 beta-lactamase family protein [Pseudoalteromonas sp. Isolate3]RZD20380.1 class A beta-lactamase-related serine hydrolase [Pseudoalteromonas sp. MEBiC 03485]
MDRRCSQTRKKTLSSLFVALSLMALPVTAEPTKPLETHHALMGQILSANQHPPLTGFALHVIVDDGHAFSTAKQSKENAPQVINPNSLFRIASVTKTFTAATVLRLHEEGKLNLDTTLDKLISGDFFTLLESDGYALDKMTLKQVLSHTAGLYDHAQSEQYLAGIMANPQQDISMREQIKRCVEWGDPIGKPGQRFSYSDTGYVLLGHIIERVTDLPLPEAVRQYLSFDKNHIENVIWEQGDTVAVDESRRVHQYLHGTDTFNWSPTVDLYGGGGLVASPIGMAKFYHALFSGKVFKHPETLELMLSDKGLPADSPYRLGIFAKEYNDTLVYQHGGFWGTLVMYEPTSQVVVAGAVTQQKDYGQLEKVMSDYLILQTK